MSPARLETFSVDTRVDLYGGNVITFRITFYILAWLLGHFIY